MNLYYVVLKYFIKKGLFQKKKKIYYFQQLHLYKCCINFSKRADFKPPFIHLTIALPDIVDILTKTVYRLKVKHSNIYNNNNNEIKKQEKAKCQ